MNVLVTSGGTKVPIDRVRAITNMSRGTFGSEIAKAFMCHDDNIALTFLRAEGSRSPMSCTLDLSRQSVEDVVSGFAKTVSFHQKHHLHYSEATYKTFDEYAHELEVECRQRVHKPDIIVLAAAVSDYGTKPLKGKMRSKTSDMAIRLHRLPKLISKVKEWCPNAFLVGFKLLVDSRPDVLAAAARDSVKKNWCDMVVANDLRDIQRDDHTVMLVYSSEQTVVWSKKKLERLGINATLAEFIVGKILEEYRRT